MNFKNCYNGNADANDFANSPFLNDSLLFQVDQEPKLNEESGDPEFKKALIEISNTTQEPEKVLDFSNTQLWWHNHGEIN